MATRINSSGTNLPFFISGAAALAAHKWWPGMDADFGQHAFAWSLLGLSSLSALSGAQALGRDIRFRRALLDSTAIGTEHGSAREATETEIEERGMFEPSSGSFFGFVYGRPVFGPKDAPFALWEAPPGSGKDVNFVTGNVLHHSLLGKSVWAPDVKLELAPMLAEGLRRAGVETWVINPTGQHLEKCGNAELGLYQAVIDTANASGDGWKDAIGIAQTNARLHLPEDKNDGAKRYFSGGARRCLTVPQLLNALIDPGKCTPADSFDMLNDPDQFVAVLKSIVSSLEPTGSDANIVEFLKSEAKNLLSRFSTNPENFGSFLEWATQVLGPYNQAGHLAEYGRTPTHNIKAMATRPITVFPMVPHSHAGEFEAFTSILNANLLSAIQRNPRKQAVHLCCNEFLNYRFADIGSNLEVMRGLGVTADFFIQSFQGLVRKYGQEAAASVNDYCDVKVYLGLNSYERAKYVSDMLSEATIASRDYSYSSSPTDVNTNTKRQGRPLMTPDEVLAMPRDQAWVFVKGLRPFRIQVRHYGHIEPWKSLIDENPLEGSPLQGQTLLKLDYPNWRLS